MENNCRKLSHGQHMWKALKQVEARLGSGKRKHCSHHELMTISEMSAALVKNQRDREAEN